MLVRLLMGAAALSLCIAGCSGGSAAGPKGWTKKNATTWTSAHGERYSVTSKKFSGSLGDLASQITIDQELGHRGARLLHSDPLTDCPAQAGVATFARGTTTQSIAFAILDGSAVTIDYQRPSALAADPAAMAAIQRELCAAPL